MTGPDHYWSAEDCMRRALSDHQGGNPEGTQMELAFATVHATLALAAATAMGSRGLDDDRPAPGMHPTDLDAWDRVCGVTS